MTEGICPVSGFSKDQQERWSHLHALLTQEVDTLHALNHPDLPRLGTEIQASLQQATMSSEELTHRKAVFRQLKKRIEFEFEGSQLHAFGSTESGTSLGAGDLDLCIVVKQQSPRRLLNKIRNVLKQMGMKDIEVIGRAKVPIVKFKDGPSGLPIDISVNNELAIYNTDLIKEYAELHPLVKETVLAVKHWASSRSINEAPNGTLSSYAWTLIALAILQANPNIALLNLQENAPKSIIQLDQSYNVGFKKGQTFVPANPSMTLAEAVLGIFDHLANDWSFDEGVCSVKHGGYIGREIKRWPHGEPIAWDMVPEELNQRLGDHSMPIEDPFQHSHDLSRVLRPEGYFDIREEIYRAQKLLSQGLSWEQVCEPIGPQTTRFERFDLFADLRTLSMEVLRNQMTEIESELVKVDVEHTEAKQRRTELAKLVKFGLRQERTIPDITIPDYVEIKERFENSVSEFTAMRNKVDEINEINILSHSRIQHQMRTIFERITEELDVMNVHNLNRERELFGSFFELKAMQPSALKAHQTYLTSKQIDADLHKEVKQLNRMNRKNSNSMKRLIKRRRTLRRERGRIEAFIRIKDGGSRPNKPRAKQAKRKSKGPDASMVKQKMSTGESVSMEELNALLNNGGLLGMNLEKEVKIEERSGKKRKKRNTNVRRGTAKGSSRRSRKE